MIEIKNRYTGVVIYRSETATTTAQAIVEMVTAARERSERADLSNANLRSADLSYANLSGADLSYANLSGADLRYANLSGADLRYADLSYANLRGADLSGADLSGANLRSADLSGANLRSADLSGADLRSADLHSLGFDQRGYHFFLYFETEPIIRAGCRSFTLEQAKSHWTSAHDDKPILKAEILGKIALAEAIIEARKVNAK